MIVRLKEALREMASDTGVRGMPNDWDRGGLPAWTYDSEELLDLEKEAVFRRNWLCAGHVSEIPQVGDYLCLDAADECALILRGRDGEVRAFLQPLPPPGLPGGDGAARPVQESDHLPVPRLELQSRRVFAGDGVAQDLSRPG